MKHLSPLFSFFIMAALFCSCSSSKDKQASGVIQIDPATVQMSGTYVKPADAARQTRPVLILPKTVDGYVGESVDENGTYYGGQYISTQVEPIRWATLEEAEASGRPYIIYGDRSPVVAMPGAEGLTGGGPAEVNLASMSEKIDSLENKLNTPPENLNNILLQGAPLASDKPMVPELPPSAFHNKIQDQHTLSGGDELVPQICIPQRPPGTKGTFLLPDSKDPILVEHLADGYVKITFQGKSVVTKYGEERSVLELGK